MEPREPHDSTQDEMDVEKDALPVAIIQILARFHLGYTLDPETACIYVPNAALQLLQPSQFSLWVPMAAGGTEEGVVKGRVHASGRVLLSLKQGKLHEPLKAAESFARCLREHYPGAQAETQLVRDFVTLTVRATAVLPHSVALLDFYEAFPVEVDYDTERQPSSLCYHPEQGCVVQVFSSGRLLLLKSQSEDDARRILRQTAAVLQPFLEANPAAR
eukprot:scaffold3058_cov232-Pinguiococcus_pyrenoidosus.AAC.4